MRKAFLLAAGLGVSVLTAGAAQAAAALPDWTGVFVAGPGEGNVLDPTAGRSADALGVRLHPPYNAAWEAKYTKAIADNARERDPGSACVRPGMPRNMAIFYAAEFVVTPKQTVILLEYPWNFRQIYTDGRGHPADLDPTYNGHSIGKWEGDTLVVETVGIHPDTWFDRTGATHSDQLRIVERIRKVGPDLIENKLTLYDPVAFTKPWEVRRTYKRDVGGRLLEFNCSENNRNPIAPDGTNLVVLNKSLSGGGQ